MTDWRNMFPEQEPGLICAYTTNRGQVADCASHISGVTLYINIFITKKFTFYFVLLQNERKRMRIK